MKWSGKYVSILEKSGKMFWDGSGNGANASGLEHLLGWIKMS